MDKEDIRRNVRAHKSLLNETDRLRAAERAFAVMEKTAAFLMADNILMYHSLPDELSTLQFLDKWHSSKRFFLPRVNGVNLEILPYECSSLHLGAFQIEEPNGDTTVPLDVIDLVVVPGIGFDRRGNRVGRGKGFYDRLLADTPVTKIGVAYDFQVFDTVPSQAHDVRVDIVITDKAYYHARSGRTVRHYEQD